MPGMRSGHRLPAAPQADEVTETDNAEPERKDLVGCEMTVEPSSDLRQDQHGDREGQHGQAGIKRRQPETVLQVERQELCHDLRRGRIGEHGKHGADEVGHPKQREVDHRPGLVGLGRQKPDECGETAGKAREGGDR